MQREILDGLKHYIFADTENWANNIPFFVNFLTKNSYLSKDTQVACIIGSDKSQKNYFEKLKEKIGTNKNLHLTPIKINSNKKNAVDMVLCSYLGMAVEKSPSAEFVIVSNDRDYAPVIDTFMALGIHIREERNPRKSKKIKTQNIQSNLPVPAKQEQKSSQKVDSPSDAKIKELSEKMYCQKSSRPLKIETLRKRVNQFQKKYNFLEKDLDFVSQKVKAYLVCAEKIAVNGEVITWK
ncbi:MAG: NYN domain-containing protein [Treponema sp.]|nr:NYN domain-containing protein [Treponema sp.]